MKTAVVEANKLQLARRLDCWYFLSPATATVSAVTIARARGLQVVRLGGPGGLASRVLHPQRYTRALAADGEAALPYLRPYDVFNYYPEAADYVSQQRTENLADYHLSRWQILQTRSGRNLGPAVMVDQHLSQFVMSDDMIRVEIADESTRFYVLAYLNSAAGRSLLRRDKTGSVIDHLSEDQVAEQEIMFFDSRTTEEAASLMREAFTLREKARLKLTDLVATYEAKLPNLQGNRPLRDGWSMKSIELSGRLDAAFHTPLVRKVRAEVLGLGGRPVSEVAKVHKPAGRYKTCYVEQEHGRPLVSGAQLLQTMPINLKFMSPSVFKNVADYELHAGWIAYPADGRAEEELGTPVLITKDREGWLASGHVGRVIPKPAIDVGWLFLALKSSHSQLQLKARSSGSVVDSTFEKDLEAVILPPKLDANGGDEAAKVWEDFATAKSFEERASLAIDVALARHAN